jgi:hypothetical protein
MLRGPVSATAEQLQKSARLRREVDSLFRETSKRPSLIGRAGRFVIRFLTAVVVMVLAIDGWFAYEAFHRDGPKSGTTASSTVGGPTYSDLQVFEDFGRFAGRVAITNPFDRDIEVFVDVDLYDGEQHVGEVSGNVSLRPDSTSVVELQGFEDFVPYTESRVHLNGWAV